MLICCMVKTTIEISDDLDRRFREAIVKKKGLHKGVIGEAYEEAIEDLIKKYVREGEKSRTGEKKDAS